VPIQLEAPSKAASAQIQPKIQPDPGSIIMPIEIPKEIARVADDAPVPAVGVDGGVFNANVSGVLRSVLLTDTKTGDVAPPPPSPPPPPPPPVMAGLTPIRVGGDIKEPTVIKLISPVYPKLAIKARVTGTVTLEATVTAEGTVDEIKVISGNPLLIEAAVDCVKQWRYEPTYLNGAPVPVNLTARVHFELRPL
jgi:periplasmic protein TonB